MENSSPSLKSLVRLAFSPLDRSLFPDPSWLLTAEVIDMKDADHARLLADRYRDKVLGYDHVALKLAYFYGVLDGVAVQEAEGG